MTEWEIIKECKQAWELLNDLHDNSQIASDNDLKIMRQCMYRLCDMYDNAYGMMLENKKDFELLKTNIKCPRCNGEMYISDLIDYAYLCNNCDENMYLTECECGKSWWNND